MLVSNFFPESGAQKEQSSINEVVYVSINPEQNLNLRQTCSENNPENITSFDTLSSKNIDKEKDTQDSETLTDEAQSVPNPDDNLCEQVNPLTTEVPNSNTQDGIDKNHSRQTQNNEGNDANIDRNLDAHSYHKQRVNVDDLAEGVDTHSCGKCQLVFTSLDEYVRHKLDHDNCKVTYSKSYRNKRVLIPKVIFLLF